MEFRSTSSPRLDPCCTITRYIFNVPPRVLEVNPSFSAACWITAFAYMESVMAEYISLYSPNSPELFECSALGRASATRILCFHYSTISRAEGEANHLSPPCWEYWPRFRPQTSSPSRKEMREERETEERERVIVVEHLSIRSLHTNTKIIITDCVNVYIPQLQIHKSSI